MEGLGVGVGQGRINRPKHRRVVEPKHPNTWMKLAKEAQVVGAAPVL